MSIKYSVLTIAHPNGEDLCFWDTLSMVAQVQGFPPDAKKSLPSLHVGDSGSTRTSLGNLLRPETQRKINKIGRDLFFTGKAATSVDRAITEGDFKDAYIPTTPDGFEKALGDYGPFVYYGQEKETNILGRHFNHTLVITGIEKEEACTTSFGQQSADQGTTAAGVK